jgi:hypothetical protein
MEERLLLVTDCLAHVLKQPGSICVNAETGRLPFEHIPLSTLKEVVIGLERFC